MMSLGSNIRNKRTSLKFSQEYVAEQLQVSRQSVSKWETGKSEPSTKNLIKLAELFSCHVNELIDPAQKVEEENSNTKQSTLFNFLGILFSFILFVVGMLYAEQFPVLAIVGILGLCSMSYLVFHIV